MPPKEQTPTSQPSSQAIPEQVDMQAQNIASPLQATITTPATPKKRVPKWLKVVLIVVLVFVFIVVIASITATTATQAPQKISDQFINSFQSGSTNDAYALTSNTFKQATTQDQLDQLIKQVGPVLQGEEKVTGRAINRAAGLPQTAVLVYDVITPNGTKYIKVTLQKNDDVWQVVNFRSADNPLDTTIE